MVLLDFLTAFNFIDLDIMLQHFSTMSLIGSPGRIILAEHSTSVMALPSCQLPVCFLGSLA